MTKLKMADHLFGYILLALAMMTVGSTVIASKIIAGNIPPFAAVAMRFALALPILLVIVVMSHVRMPNLRRRDWGLLALQAAAGSVGYTVLLISGLNFLPAATAGVVIGTLPAVSALFAVLVLRERSDYRIAASVTLATIGVMSVAWTGREHGSLVGMVLVLGAVICESAFILLNKRMDVLLPPLLQSTVMTAFGLLFSLPFVAFGWEGVKLSISVLAAIAWYALIPTVGGFLLWYAGAARVSGGEAATFTAIAPLTAVALAAVFLGESIGLSQLLGMVTVIAAILVLSLPVRRRSGAK